MGFSMSQHLMGLHWLLGFNLPINLQMNLHHLVFCLILVVIGGKILFRMVPGNLLGHLPILSIITLLVLIIRSLSVKGPINIMDYD